MSSIPQVPGLVGQQVADYIKSSQGSSSVSDAATAARGNAEVSDRIMQQIMQQISGGDMSGMVQNRPSVMLPTPVMPKQMPMGEPQQIHATTAGGQKRNDISSLISSVGNIVKAGVNKKREKESRDLEADLALITAASSNPQDLHNRAILDALSQDPKRMKRLEKAIGYNPLSGEPPPPETQTMMKFSKDNRQKQEAKQQQITQAIAQHLGPQAAQQGGAAPSPVPGQQPGHAMDALMARMPNTPQLSPMVQLQAGLIKAGILPSADKSLTALTSLFKDIMTNDAKYAEVIGRLQVKDKELAGKLQEVRERGRYLLEQEKMKQEGAGARINSRANTAIETAKIRAGATVQSAKIHAEATVDSAKIRANAQKEAAKIRQENVSKRADVTKQHKLLVDEVKQIDQDIKNLDVQIASADKTRKPQLIQEQQMKKELKNAKEQLMDVYDKQGAQLDTVIKQSPTSQLDSGTSNEDDLSKEMDDEDKIF